jgi:copper chaperone CopZ
LTDVAAPENEVSGTRRIQLDVAGMSCGMCAASIQRKLNKIDGVRASVSFASKVANVEAGDGVTVAELCDVVRKAGYGAEQRSIVTVDSDALDTRRAGGPLQRLLASAFGWMTFRW